ncbi:hypothetical protein COCCADRAFT_113656, partial [Bipolaris zeicola 26-R-13]
NVVLTSKSLLIITKLSYNQLLRYTSTTSKSLYIKLSKGTPIIENLSDSIDSTF